MTEQVYYQQSSSLTTIMWTSVLKFHSFMLDVTGWTLDSLQANALSKDFFDHS